MSQNTDIRDAVIQQIVAASLVPTTTLAAPTTVGATQVTLSDASFVVEGGILDWNDGTGEFPCKIDAIAGSILTLSFQGRTVTGLQYAHAAGAQVMTNILRAPANPDDATTTDLMCGNTWPTWRVYTLDAVANPDGRQLQPYRFCEIVHQLPALPRRLPLQSELYTQQQMDRGEADMDVLDTALRKNYNLPLNGAPTCQIILRYWRSSRRTRYGPADNEKVPLYEQYLALQVLANTVTLG